ncbi:MAG TPA: MerR family transcriptional regulator [bacterium]
MPSTRSRRASASPAPQEYPIGSLAKLADVSTRTVRYYEEIGLLTTARRFAGGRRVFAEDALQRLRFIGRLKRLGFALEEIKHLNEVFALHRSTGDMLTVLDKQLATHLDVLNVQISELAGLKKDLLTYRQRIRSRLAVLRSQASGGRP